MLPLSISDRSQYTNRPSFNIFKTWNKWEEGTRVCLVVNKKDSNIKLILHLTLHHSNIFIFHNSCWETINIILTETVPLSLSSSLSPCTRTNRYRKDGVVLTIHHLRIGLRCVFSREGNDPMVNFRQFVSVLVMEYTSHCDLVTTL